MAISLLKKYSKLGISLHIATTKKLCYKVPRGAITIDIMQEIKAHKVEIIICLYQQQIQHLDLPAPWKLALTKLMTCSQPSKITNDRWNMIIAQIHLWLNQDLPQLQKIIADGWTIQDIFCCHKTRPYDQQRAGLLMLIPGNTVITVNMGAIMFKTTLGAGQRHYKNIKSFDDETLIYKLAGTGGVVASSTTVINEPELTDLVKLGKLTESNCLKNKSMGLKVNCPRCCTSGFEEVAPCSTCGMPNYQLMK